MRGLSASAPFPARPALAEARVAGEGTGAGRALAPMAPVCAACGEEVRRGGARRARCAPALAAAARAAGAATAWRADDDDVPRRVLGVASAGAARRGRRQGGAQDREAFADAEPRVELFDDEAELDAAAERVAGCGRRRLR